MCDCFGTELGNVEHNENSLLWAMDNWMHTSEGDTYFRFKDGKMETRRTLSRGQWGATQDDFGRVYRNSNSSALHIDLLVHAVLRCATPISCGPAAATSSWAIPTN